MSTTPDSKRDRRLAARADRQRSADLGRRKSQRRRRLTIGLLAALGLALVLGIGLLLSQSAFAQKPGRTLTDEGREHVAPGAPLSYKTNPPASGPHYTSWTRPGVYTDPVDPGNWIHSLEHGYVAILYNCPNGCPDTIQQLRDFYENAPKSGKYRYQKLVILPYTNMESRLAAVAWNRIDEMEEFNADRLMAFYRAYFDKGPEDAA